MPSQIKIRGYIDPVPLKELASSIKEHGVISPIMVRQLGDSYELIHGERRFRAAKLAGLREIPAIVKNTYEKDAVAIGLVENLQREDVDPIFEARGFKALQQKHGLTAAEIGRKVGKSESYVYQRLRLLELSPHIQDLILNNMLNPSAAMQLLRIPEQKERDAIAASIVRHGVTVEGAQRLVDAVLAVKEKGEEREKKVEALVERPVLLWPCDCCEREFKKEYLENFKLCGECSQQLWSHVQDIRALISRNAAEQTPSEEKRGGLQEAVGRET